MSRWQHKLYDFCANPGHDPDRGILTEFFRFGIGGSRTNFAGSAAPTVCGLRVLRSTFAKEVTIFISVCLFVCLFVCLIVCWQDHAKTAQPIFVKFGEQAGHGRNR